MTVIFASNKILLRHIEALTRIRALYNNPYDFYPGEIKMKKSLFITTVALVVPFLFSCDKETEIAPLESISVTYIDKDDENKVKDLPASFSLEKGEERVIKVTGNPESVDRVFTWESSYPDAIQVISSTIRVYSVPPTDKNPVTITVTDKDKTKTASFSIEVLEKGAETPVAPTGINLSHTNANLILGGDSLELLATVTPFDAKDRLVNWEITEGLGTVINFDGPSVDPSESAPTVTGQKSSAQKISAVDMGTATIKVTHRNNPSISATLGVTVTTEPGVIPVESMAFAISDLYVTEGDTTQNNLTIRPFNASEEAREVTYSSSNTTVADVDLNSGIVTAKVPGIAVITATQVNGGLSANYTLHVEQRYINYLHIKEKDSAVWTNEELNEASGNEHHIASRHFDRGDIFCFALNEGSTWYKYAEFENKDALATSICADGENLRVLKAGDYEIFVKTAEHANPGIYINPLSYDPVVLNPKLLINYAAGGSDEITITLKAGSETEYNKKLTFNEGDSFVAKISDEIFGYSDIKEESTNQVLEGGLSNYIVVKGNLTLDIYVESGAPDARGDFIYISTNFVQIYNPSTSKWSYKDIPLKGGSETEFNLINESLAANQKILFFLHAHYDGEHYEGRYFKYENIKGASPTKPYLGFDDDGNIVIQEAGTYSFYIETAVDGGNGYGIYIDGLPTGITYVTYTLNLDSGNSWIINDNAKIYAWCWNLSNQRSFWIQGEIHGTSNITFSVPSDRDKAKFVRCEFEIPDRSAWNEGTAGANIWNESNEISLSGTSSTISPVF